jgi:pilus assembly protein CpaF
MSAFDEIRSEALLMLDRRRVDPASDPLAARALLEDLVDEYERRSMAGTGRALGSRTSMVDRLLMSLTGFGHLSDVLTSADVEEIFIEGARVTYLDTSGRLRPLGQPTSASEIRHVVDRLVASADRRLDASSPIVQAQVLDGTARLTAVAPPISTHLSVTIRRFIGRNESLEGLVAVDAVSPDAADLFRRLMAANSSVVISGPPGAGKTTLLSAMVRATPPDRCIRVVEEVRELRMPLLHGSCYETRGPGMDGSASLTLRDLIKVVLAMRPDRIVVGEVRGAEAFELTRAINAGTGFACTVHANSATDALDALTNAALMAGEHVPADAVRSVLVAAVDLVIHLELEMLTGETPFLRGVREVAAVDPSDPSGRTLIPLFTRQRLDLPLEKTGSPLPDRLRIRLDRLGAR